MHLQREVTVELAWTNQLSIGNAIIDSDHKNLIAGINGIVHAIKARDRHAMPQVFEALENWLHIHFENEERIARAVNFDFSGHKQAQRHSLKELQHMRDGLIAMKGMWPDSATNHSIGFLKNWIIDGHIVNFGMQMKPALQAFDYKFWPGWREGETNNIAGHIASLYLKLFDTPMPCAG
ncbi:MAG: hemerythrin domain-containing protein [Gallionella sp.]|nr:hemerythrin domain-containing protein [Gallionella sp.]